MTAPSPGPRDGATVLLDRLRRRGAQHLFGVPGTQSLPIWEALRRSPLQSVLATNELAATFMAIGSHHASRVPAIVSVIPGPGVGWACAALAEARADSVPLIVLVPRSGSVPAWPRAADPLPALAALAKARVVAESFASIVARVDDAWSVATSGEPGPVVLEVASSALEAVGSADTAIAAGAAPPDAAHAVETVVRELLAARRPLLVIGAGATAAGSSLRALAEVVAAPVLTSGAGRGLMPEDHPLSMAGDTGLSAVDAVNELIGLADLVVALGWRGSPNATVGHRLRLPSEKLVRVDTSEEVLAATPARHALLANAADVVEGVLARLAAPGSRRVSEWDAGTLSRLRASSAASLVTRGPAIAGASPPAFFAALRATLPADACLVTDSGQHQIVARRHYPVLRPGGLLFPFDFQSMGFGLPAAIGVKLAAPERQVVALLGDGALLMSAMELLTAKRLGLELPVLVFADRRLGLIHGHQVHAYGHAHGTSLELPDFEALAGALGVGFARICGGSSLEEGLAGALRGPGVTLVEVPVEDGLRQHASHLKSRARVEARGAGERLKRWFSRRGGRG